MTKTFTPLASAIALTLAMAPAAFADSSSFEGIYGGLSVGSVGIDPNFSPSTLSNAPGYELFLGYNHALDSSWIIGGELGFGTSGDHTVSGSGAQVRLEDMVTISARAGYVFDETMIYGRIGYQTGEMSITGTPVTPDLDGYIFGLGVEHNFTDRVAGRFEVSHGILDLSGPGVPPGAEIERTSVSLGIVFRF